MGVRGEPVEGERFICILLYVSRGGLHPLDGSVMHRPRSAPFASAQPGAFCCIRTGEESHIAGLGGPRSARRPAIHAGGDYPVHECAVETAVTRGHSALHCDLGRHRGRKGEVRHGNVLKVETVFELCHYGRFVALLLLRGNSTSPVAGPVRQQEADIDSGAQAAQWEPVTTLDEDFRD
jgi:hypothetical protein